MKTIRLAVAVISTAAVAGCSTTGTPAADNGGDTTVVAGNTVAVTASAAAQPPATVTVTHEAGPTRQVTQTVASTATVTAAHPAGAGTLTLADCPTGVVITQPGAVLLDRPIVDHGDPVRLASVPDFSTMCLVARPDNYRSWAVEWNSKTVYIAKDLAYEQDYMKTAGIYVYPAGAVGPKGKKVTIAGLKLGASLSLIARDPDADPNGTDLGLKLDPVKFGKTVGDAIAALGSAKFIVDTVIRVPAGFSGDLPKDQTLVSSFEQFSADQFAGFGFGGVAKVHIGSGLAAIRYSAVMPTRRVSVVVVDPSLSAAEVYGIAAG